MNLDRLAKLLCPRDLRGCHPHADWKTGLAWSQYNRLRRDEILSTCAVRLTMQVGGQSRDVVVLSESMTILVMETTVAAIRRTPAADGDGLHVLANFVATTKTDEEWEEAYRLQVGHSAKIFAKASALRDGVLDLERALAEARKGAAKPERGIGLASPPRRPARLPRPFESGTSWGERLRIAIDEIGRLRAEVADLIVRPRGTLPASWGRSSPIERASTLEAWASDEGPSAMDRRWAKRLLAAMESDCEVDRRDAKRFTLIIRRI